MWYDARWKTAGRNSGIALNFPLSSAGGKAEVVHRTSFPDADYAMPQNPLTGIGSRRAAIRIAGLYVVLGLAWIWLSDWALNLVGFAADGAFLAGAAKGTAFVVLTAGVLYGLVSREVSAVEESERLLRAVLTAHRTPCSSRTVEDEYCWRTKRRCSSWEKQNRKSSDTRIPSFLREQMDEMPGV